VEARAIFFQAMRGQDRPFLSWIGVARASIAMGDLRTADVAIGQAMQTNPGNAASIDLVARTLLMVAQAMGEGGRSQALMADALFRSAERADPDLPKLAYHRGLAHLAANEATVAVPLLERAATIDPGDENALRALLIAYERSGQIDRGREVVETLRRENRLPPSMAFWGARSPESSASRPAKPEND
jgi:predicted Zn-dependent protease